MEVDDQTSKPLLLSERASESPEGVVREREREKRKGERERSLLTKARSSFEREQQRWHCACGFLQFVAFCFALLVVLVAVLVVALVVALLLGVVVAAALAVGFLRLGCALVVDFVGPELVSAETEVQLRLSSTWLPVCSRQKRNGGTFGFLPLAGLRHYRERAETGVPGSGAREPPLSFTISRSSARTLCCG